ncbi:MAG: response regulator transcription factor [Planctomycetes bacterium]|nr:response regulator transcription factor [Planctomycetota bacterium]
MNLDRPVLLVEDDEVLAEMVQSYLTTHGFEVRIEGHGDRAVERITAENPLLVILDLGLPGLDGFEVCRRVRESYNGFILVMTAQGDEVDEVACLEIGADDFLAKPVSPRVLLAHMRALLRRYTQTASNQSKISVGDLDVNAGRREARFKGLVLNLTSSEFDLLEYLASHAGEIVSRSQLYEELRGVKYDGLDRSIDLRVSRLRAKIEDHPSRPKLIKSVRGVGYLLASS